MKSSIVTQAENICIRRFNQFFKDQYDRIIQPKDGYAPVDLKVIKGDKTSYWELKNMSYRHTEFKDRGYIIDTKKFETLQQLSNTRNIIYCMFWSDSVATVWNFSKLTPSDYHFAPIKRLSTTLTTDGSEKTGAYLLSYDSAVKFTTFS